MQSSDYPSCRLLTTVRRNGPSDLEDGEVKAANWGKGRWRAKGENKEERERESKRERNQFHEITTHWPQPIYGDSAGVAILWRGKFSSIYLSLSLALPLATTTD